jgi:hypothetical protein
MTVLDGITVMKSIKGFPKMILDIEYFVDMELHLPSLHTHLT